VLLLSLFLTILFSSSVARADDETAGDEYDVDARVVRISLISGDVSFRRHDTEDWETAKLNTPLVEGDMLATGSGSRAEIQIDARNFLRIAADSVIKIVTLRNEGVALSLSKGTATLRLARFDKDHEYFEIDAPQTTIAAEAKGLYRLEADSKGVIRLAVHDGGQARVYSDTAGFTVSDGHSATFAGDWQFAAAATKDEWDNWVSEREKYLASHLKYDQDMRYYEADLWGAEDLDSYGTWEYANDYGWIWQPNVTIINTYTDWAPYRYGEWVWCAPYGWTWVGDEPWGWAPYHFGRWVFYNGRWAWCPHSYYRPSHSWWRPALVAFFGFDLNFGNYCWYPLGYQQRDPRSNYYEHHRDRLTPLRADELANLKRRNPAYFRAVTTIPARDFGNPGGRPQRATDDLGRRAFGAQPLREGLPTRPSTGTHAGTNGGTRGLRSGPVYAARPTGAAPRTPGVPLDTELRRSRVFNGRDPISNPATTNFPRTVDPGTTGAVARPPRPVEQQPTRPTEPRRNPDTTGGTVPVPIERNRPTRSREGGTMQPAPTVEPTRQERPTAPPERRAPSGDSTPVRPTRTERTEQPAPTNETPISHPAPPQRSEPPAQRTEAPPQRTEPPPQRSEPPPQRSEPPPQRSEPPPQRSEPPPQRSEPPPQRSEPPPQRSEPPPQRSEPPPQRSEPAPQRSAPPERSEPSKPAKP
jgi:hypothetical protein